MQKPIYFKNGSHLLKGLVKLKRLVESESNLHRRLRLSEISDCG